MRKFITLTLVISLLGGCETATLYDEFKRDNQIDKHFIDNTISANTYEKVVMLKRPPQSLQVVEDSDTPEWYGQKTQINASELPLSLMVRQILGDKVSIKYGLSVDPAKKSSIFFEGTKQEALNILSLYVDYGITYSGDTVSIDKFTTKTYQIPNTIGEESFQMGSSDSSGMAATSEDALEGEISSTGGGDGQHSNTVISNYNLTEQIYQGVEKILQGEGNITTGGMDASVIDPSMGAVNTSVLGYAEVVKGTSSIVVRTSPAMMLLVDDYVESVVRELKKEVELEVTVIEYQQEDGSEFGIDATLNRMTSDGDFSLDVESPSLTNVANNFGLGFVATSGLWEGSSAVIKALRQSGSVTVNTSQRVLASNHKAQEIDLSSIQAYISSAETTFEGTDGNIPVTTLEKSEVRDGVKLLAVANIQDERIYLKLNGVLSKVIVFDDTTINGITIRSPRTRQSRFNISGAYDFNKTFVVTHMRQVTSENNEAKFADVSTGNSGSKKIIDTLVLLTPRKVYK
ncbi:hypothetical protein [Enterovibrio norvegicus]|uniref:hypothetical protein n=1 Tax=Enterovibrio norvegicus TaxID=188144 RepID=UPI000C821ADA|nr:hypothetical protein [Enterovibrio norvegicus]PMH64445.1 hypothetical protein BCU62_15435 [Enterovibrio norvegicus]